MKLPLLDHNAPYAPRYFVWVAVFLSPLFIIVYIIAGVFLLLGQITDSVLRFASAKLDE
jgi:hypothetical protein